MFLNVGHRPEFVNQIKVVVKRPMTSQYRRFSFISFNTTQYQIMFLTAVQLLSDLCMTHECDLHHNQYLHKDSLLGPYVIQVEEDHQRLIENVCIAKRKICLNPLFDLSFGYI